MAHLYAGTSGFAYASWKPDFYPAKLPSKKFLSLYCERLNAVEINYTFRRLPSATTLENWVNETRAGFIFSLKAHMRITHIQRLKPSEFTEVFFRAIDPLRASRRLGPVLFQLPPAMKCDEALLGEFLQTLPRDGSAGNGSGRRAAATEQPQSHHAALRPSNRSIRPLRGSGTVIGTASPFRRRAASI